MAVVKKSIIVEDKVEEILSKLPLFKNSAIGTEHKHFFKKGEDDEINAFLSKSSDPYPLIWLAYPFEENHSFNFKNVNVTNLTFVIAVKGNVTNFIEDRFEKIYKNILLNVFDNIAYLFNKASNFKVTSNYKVVKFPNYMKINRNASVEGNKAIDVWDAIKVTFNCNINDKCSNL